jgi:MoxR-like ATPase
VLLEGVPGLAKTLTVKTLSGAIQTGFQRIQFTPDLLPADLVGTLIYNPRTGEFTTKGGPLFSNLILADEINRAPAKVQSALLEAMEEKQVSIEGRTHPLPTPFFVIATQNPQEQLGTNPLPESQLDRFLMRVSLGYPDRASELQLLAHHGHRAHADQLPPQLTSEELAALQQAVLQVHAAEPLLHYIQDLVDATRNGQWFVQGLSPRAGIALLRAAKANALLHGRDYASPDDVQAMFVPTMAHRLHAVARAGRGTVAQVQALLHTVALP